MRQPAHDDTPRNRRPGSPPSELGFWLTNWAMLLALVAMWGSAFLLTKLAVATVPPALVVVGRLWLAAAVLVSIVLVTGRRLPARRRHWLFAAGIALFGNALPFSLITWGQQFVDSGLAGILMAIMPLSTLALAHAFVPNERLNPGKVVGFGLGFIGILVLIGPAHIMEAPTAVGAQLAIVAGALSYSLASILARLRPRGEALAAAAATLFLAAVMATPMGLVAWAASLAVSPEGVPVPPPQAISPWISLGAVALLGLFPTALATLVYFRLIHRTGPTFLATSNYLIPVWAVGAGIVVLGESLAPSDGLALAMILGGIALAQLWSRWTGRRTRVDAASRHTRLPR